MNVQSIDRHPRRLQGPVPNALTVDVEEYYHATLFQEATKGMSTSALESRVRPCVDRILSLMAAHGARATFFIVGEVAEDHPRLVRDIEKAGHEIACHSYRHQRVSGQSPEQFRADVRRTKSLLEDLSGKPVLGYRAPSCSIGRSQPWAYDILLEEGFRYDSSSYPILHDHYGDITAPRFAHVVRKRGSEQLVEFPMGTARVFGVNLPIAGGGYFRLLPLAFTRYGIRWVNRREGKSVLFFFHPWELDKSQPRFPLPWLLRFRLHVGIRRQQAKLNRLFREFRFRPVRDFLGSIES